MKKQLGEYNQSIPAGDLDKAYRQWTFDAGIKGRSRNNPGGVGGWGGDLDNKQSTSGRGNCMEKGRGFHKTQEI